MSFLILALSGKFTDGARVALETRELNMEETQWGRSCESLQTRFHNQQGRLAEGEGNTALIRSVSLMRTLRRANARDCEWLTNGDVDISVAAAVATRYLHQSPCYEPARGAFTRAQTLPEEEREHGVQLAMEIMLSENEGCEPQSVVEAPELNESEEMLENELDDDTDEIMEELAASSGTSLMEQLPINPVTIGAASWVGAVIGGWPMIIASILMAILLGMLCRSIVHMIIRIFRWIRCKLFGNSCSEYSPAGWLRVLVTGGCGLTGTLMAPITTFLTAPAGVTSGLTTAFEQMALEVSR